MDEISVQESADADENNDVLNEKVLDETMEVENEVLNEVKLKALPKKRKTPGRRKKVSNKRKASRRAPVGCGDVTVDAVEDTVDASDTFDTFEESDDTLPSYESADDSCDRSDTVSSVQSWSTLTASLSSVVEYQNGCSEEESLTVSSESSVMSSSELETKTESEDEENNSGGIIVGQKLHHPFFKNRKKRRRERAETRRRKIFKRAKVQEGVRLVKAPKMKPRGKKTHGCLREYVSNFFEHQNRSYSFPEDSDESFPMSMPSHEGAHFLVTDHDADPTMIPPFDEVKESPESIIVKQEILEALKLDKLWNTDIQEGIKIMKMTLDMKVERAIVYNNHTKSIEVLIHDQPLPNDHPLWQLAVIDDVNSPSSIAACLSKLAHHIINWEICHGCPNQEYAYLWKDGVKGKIDRVSDLPCFRSSNCSILLFRPESCPQCKYQTTDFKRKYNRQHKTQDHKKDKRKINHRFMTTEEISGKTKAYYNRIKREKERNQRLKNYIEATINSIQEPIEKETSDDLVVLLQEVLPKMSDLQKLFWEEQLKAIKMQDNPRAIHWHPMMIKMALALQANGPRYFVDIGCISLPSKRRLYDYSHFVDAEEGCQPEIILNIKKKIENLNLTNEHYVNLLFDEINIRGNVVYNKKGELVGFVKMTEVEAELAKMEKSLVNMDFEPPLAKKVLAFMVTEAGTIQSNIREIVALYSTGDLTAAQLYVRGWEVMHVLEEADIKVLTMIFDGASVNRRFVHMHTCSDSISDVVYVTKNLAADSERPLFFILDPPHFIKTVRNCYSNSYAHKGTRKLWNAGQDIKWPILQKLYEVTSANQYLSHKLTASHLKLTAFSKMNVRLAVQAMSGSVEECLLKLKDDPRFKDFGVEETAKFIGTMNKFWDCVNSRQRKSTDINVKDNKEPFLSKEDPRLAFLTGDFLQYFKDWDESVENRKGKFSKEERNKMKIGHQTMEAMKISCKSIKACTEFLLDRGAPFVETRSFNQDPIEQYFSTMRRMQGSDDNLDLNQALNTRLNIAAQQGAALPRLKGNTEVLNRTVTIENEPLPTRKRKAVPSTSSATE
ncbi:uncharacterized protein LOC117640683 isoform X2 [Thrips palmi]|uniref:Uncharacterized protein LOC117640683 isoform X2 n=1 Tax=Thrips palmi TaxID=161013 RepID=A0A6P8YAX6_THRPL|nr:uncharacterized protein LOC117640683 isoform X2 [Thrips palmi]